VQHSVTRVDREFHFLGRHISVPFRSTSSRETTAGRARTMTDYRSDGFLGLQGGPLHGRLRARIWGQRNQAAFFVASASTSTP
jgi:hypothetical protein